ncbi:GyrI-like domain-containing protein [Pseudomonadota bacterium]
MIDVNVVDFTECKVAALEHRGAPELLSDSFSRFDAWRQQSDESPLATSNTYGLAYTNPESTAADDFKFDVCGAVSSDVRPNEYGVVTKSIPGGRCAHIRHIGSRSHEVMGPKVKYLFREWLTANGERLRGHPSIFQYINFPSDVAEDELITDIYLPIQ